MNQYQRLICLSISVFAFSTSSLAATVILPPSPVGSSFYILPGVYGSASDRFILDSIFNAQNGNISGGQSAVTISGLGTFVLSNTGVINQSIGGASGVGSLRAIVLAKAGATIINQGTINGISNSTVENTFGMVANSVQSGLPTKSAYAYNYGIINMQGASTDGMHAAGTTAVRSYVVNDGTINVADRVTGVSNWIEGLSASGNGAVLNDTSGIVNAYSKAGSRGSSGVFGGYNQPGFDGTNAFSLNDPQMINKGTVNSFDDSHGFYYWGDFKTFGRNDGIVNITGRGHGVYFDNSGTVGAGSGFLNSASGTITTTNANSYGVYLRFLNNIFAENDGTIQTNGDRAHGMVAYSTGSSATNESTGSIITNGDSAVGIFYSASALNNAGFKWNLGTIEVNGTNSFGIATPQSFFRNDGTIIVTGANSYGMLAGGSYNITPDGTIPNNTNLGGLTPVSATQGAAQTVANHGRIDAAAASTIGLGAQGTNSVAMNSDDGIINATNTGIGLLARSGAVAQNNGEIVVGANSVGMQIESGSSGSNVGIINFTAQTGSLIGNLTNSGTLFYDAGNGSANYPIQGSLTNSGVVYLGGTPGNQLTVMGDYIGQNGTIGLNTFLAGDHSPSNVFVIDGGTATGSTGLAISNTLGPGAAIINNGILVVNTINGGTTDIDAFHLAAPAVAGPYEYYLVRGAHDGSDSQNWYLRDTFDNPEPDPPLPPSPDVPIGDDIPLYSREVSLAAAIPSVALLYDQFVLGTLHDRVGEQEQINGDKPPKVYLNGIWTRALTQSGNYNSNGIYYAGPSFNYYFNALQVGVDIYHDTNLRGSSNFAGVIGTYGKEHGNVDHLRVINAGRNDFDAWTLGGYFTHYDPQGWYIDNVLLSTFHQIDANSERNLSSILANGFGVAASIESGYNVGLPHDFGIEPEAQLSVERLTLNNSRDSRAVVSFEPTNSILGRLGARLTHTWEIANFTPNLFTGWLFANVLHQFQGDSRTNFSSLTGNIPFSSNVGVTSTQFGLGLTVLVHRNISFYSTGNFTNDSAGHGHSGGAEVGVRINV